MNRHCRRYPEKKLQEDDDDDDDMPTTLPSRSSSRNRVNVEEMMTTNLYHQNLEHCHRHVTLPPRIVTIQTHDDDVNSSACAQSFTVDGTQIIDAIADRQLESTIEQPSCAEEGEHAVVDVDSVAFPTSSSSSQYSTNTKELRFPAEQLGELFYIDELEDDNVDNDEEHDQTIQLDVDGPHGEREDDEETGSSKNMLRIPDIVDTDKVKATIDGIVSKIKLGKILTVEGLKDALTKEIPSMISTVPDKMKKIPPTVVKFTKKTVEGSNQVVITAERFGEEVVRRIADLPKKASPTWKGNLMTIAVLVTFPSIIALAPYLIGPLLSPVDDGYNANKTFVWGYTIPFEAIQIYPVIELCNQAMPTVEISIRSRIITLLVSIALSKALQYIVWVNGIVTDGQTVFPFPLSPISSAFLGSMPIVPLLYVLSQQETRHHFNVRGMLGVVGTIWVTAFLGVIWVVGIYYTRESRMWQNLVAGLFGLVVYFCRIEIGSKTTKHVNEHRWPQMNATGSIILFNFQFFAYPYIRGPIQLCILLSSQILAIHWKIWAVADRFMSAGRRLKALNAARRANEVASQQLPGALCNIAEGLIRESLFDAIEAKQLDHGELVRSMTSETLDMSSSISDNEITDEFHQIPIQDLSFESEIVLQIVNAEEGEDNCDIIDFDDLEEDHGSANPGDIFRATINEGVDDTIEATNDSGGGNIHETYETNQQLRFRKSPSPIRKGSGVKRLDARFSPVQRYIYLLMESINTVVIFFITRSQQETENILLRTFLVPKANLSNDFRVPIINTSGSNDDDDDDDFIETQVYGWSGIVLMVLVLMYLTWQVHGGGRLLIHYRGEMLTMSKILAYSFSKFFWLYFWWLSAMSLSANMGSVKHWGMDYSFKFKYFDCLDDTMWPGCPP